MDHFDSLKVGERETFQAMSLKPTYQFIENKIYSAYICQTLQKVVLNLEKLL